MTLEQFLQPLSVGLSHSPLTALGITFAGGIVASAVCPCTVPMGLGVAGLAGASQVRARYGGLQVSAAFFAGIVISLSALGGVAGRLGALATEAAISIASMAVKSPRAVPKPKRSTSPKIRLPSPKPTKSVKTFKPMACPGRWPLREVTMPARSGCVMS